MTTAAVLIVNTISLLLLVVVPVLFSRRKVQELNEVQERIITACIAYPI